MDVQTRRDILKVVEHRGLVTIEHLIGSHICCVDWHNNRWLILNGHFVSSASHAISAVAELLLFVLVIIIMTGEGVWFLILLHCCL